jgi:hypothetical protein
MHLNWQSETPDRSWAEHQHGRALIVAEVYRGEVCAGRWWFLVKADLPAAGSLPALSVELDSHDDRYRGESDQASARERAGQVAARVVRWLGAE